MAFSFKKTAAAAMAIICTASMCGCMDSGYIGSINGIQIRNGMYLSYVMSAYSDGHTEVTEAKSEAGDTSEVADLYVETIDGKNAKDWIKDEALNSAKRYAAVKTLFNENGLSLTADDTKMVNDYINSMWDNEDMYAQYIYGTDTMGEYYDSIGIGKDSMKEIQTAQLMEERLFMYYYDAEGEKAVSIDEINAYLKENSANVKYIEMPFDDKYGLNLQEEAEIQAVKDKAQEYVDRLNGGESFIEIQYEYDLQNARNEAAVEAENALEDETGEALTDEEFDAYIQEAYDSATTEKKATVEELEKVIDKESSSLDEGLTEFIWNLPDDGKAALYTTDDAVYVVVRDDITTKTDWIEGSKAGILEKLKGDEYRAFLDDAAKSYSVELDDYLVNTKYSPENVKGINENK